MSTVCYFMLSLLSLLYVLPIILANVDYKDDLGRSISGAIGYSGDGRPLGEWLVSFLCGGFPYTSIAPLSLILSVLFLSYALVLYAQINLYFISDKYILIPVLLSVITNPLAVECLSYKSTSITIIIALSLPFIMYAIPNMVSNPLLFIYSFFLCMAIMSLYQASIGLCLVLFVINVFFAVIGERNLNYLREGIRFTGIGIAAVFYKIVIAAHYVARDDWRYEASQMVDFQFSSIKTIIRNIANASHYIMVFFGQSPIWYRLSLITTILLSIIVIIILYCRKNSDTNKGG